MTRHAAASIVVAVEVLATASCGRGPSTTAGSQGLAVAATGSSSTTAPSPSGSAGALPRIQLPVAKGDTVEGLVAVNGHDLYASCYGTGAPTVVYFTGWAGDPSKRGVDAIRAIDSVDGGRHRICAYERRNTGRSQQVPGTQKPQDVVDDVDGLLAALGEKGPFILLGASYGGIIADAYAVAHPDRTAGILMLDAAITDDWLIEKHNRFSGMCLPANRADDAWHSVERIDNCALTKWVYDRRANEPHVPLIYLAAAQNRDPSDIAVDPIRKAFVKRWSPGIWEMVNTPHWMDESDPELVVNYLDKVTALSEHAH